VKYSSWQSLNLIPRRYPAGRQCLVGSLTGAVPA
jgi:hypothetical protein